MALKYALRLFSETTVRDLTMNHSFSKTTIILLSDPRTVYSVYSDAFLRSPDIMPRVI